MEVQDERKEQHAAASTSSPDLTLPKAVLKRLVKYKLASMSEDEKGELQISSDALMAFGESAKVLISYIASTSNDIAREGKRQTISVHDVHRALEDCDFDDFLGPLEAKVSGFRQQQAQGQGASKKAKGGGNEASNRGRKKQKGPATEEQGQSGGAGPEEKGAAGLIEEGEVAGVDVQGAEEARVESEGDDVRMEGEGEGAKDGVVVERNKKGRGAHATGEEAERQGGERG